MGTGEMAGVFQLTTSLPTAPLVQRGTCQIAMFSSRVHACRLLQFRLLPVKSDISVVVVTSSQCKVAVRSFFWRGERLPDGVEISVEENAGLRHSSRLLFSHYCLLKTLNDCNLPVLSDDADDEVRCVVCVYLKDHGGV